MVTPARETMEREPILYDVVGHEAEAAAFQKKLVGAYKLKEYKLKPFNPFTCVYCLFCCTLTGSYTISDAGDDELKLRGNTHVACCGCIPLENILLAGGWRASDPSQTITASNGTVFTSTLTKFERTGQIATLALSGSSKRGSITGTQVVTTSTNHQKFKTGSIAWDMVYKRQWRTHPRGANGPIGDPDSRSTSVMDASATRPPPLGST